MKKFILIALTILPISIFAQKVDKDGNIEYKGEQIGRIEKNDGFPKSYSLFNADNKEIVKFEPNGLSTANFGYNVTFLNTDNKGECPGNFEFNKKIAKAFVKSELVSDGAYQRKKEAKFMSSISGGVYLGGNTDIPTNKEGGAKQADLVERNRDAIIQVFGNKVQQDSKEIASVEKSQLASEGTIIKRIKIYNHEGTQIAEAIERGLGIEKYELTTLKDNKMYLIEPKSSTSIVKDIVSLLVAKFYL